MTESTHFRALGRRSVPVRVSVRVGAAEREALLRDLSIGGAFVACDEPPPVGTDVSIIVPAPSTWNPLVLEACVRWTREPGLPEGPGFGIEFGALTDAQAAAVYDLIAAFRYEGDEGERGG